MTGTTEGQLILVQNDENASHSREGRYEIPDDAWDMDDLGRCADSHHRFIHTAETLLTSSYWCLGRALELLRAKLSAQRFGQFLQVRGIHKVRASKARAIARFYLTPEELAGISVHDAYAAIAQKHPKPEPTNPQAGNPEDDLQGNSPAATSVTSTLVALNALLERLAENLASEGIGPDEPYPWVVSQLDSGIAMLEGMKTKLQE